MNKLQNRYIRYGAVIVTLITTLIIAMVVLYGLGKTNRQIYSLTKETTFSEAPDNTKVGCITGESNAENIWQFLVTSTLADGTPINDTMAASIMGNLQAESNLDPDCEDSAGHAYGIAQWSLDRRQNFEDYAENEGEDVSDLSVQLAFLLYEQSSWRGERVNDVDGQWVSKACYDAWVKACTEGNLVDATALYMNKLEYAPNAFISENPRVLNWGDSCPQRIRYAKAWLETYEGVIPDRSKTYDVLFVGASTTRRSDGSGDIPAYFTGLAEAAGYTVDVDYVTMNGKTLDTVAKKKGDRITEKSYDYVILQEGTRYHKDYSNYRDSVNSVVKLVRDVNPDVKIILRQMWMYKNTKKSSLEKAWDNAEGICEELELAGLSRDGKAFSEAMYDYDLFSDPKNIGGHHQNETGAYLAACCVYNAVFHIPVTGNDYLGDMKSSRAYAMQAYADDVRDK